MLDFTEISSNIKSIQAHKEDVNNGKLQVVTLKDRDKKVSESLPSRVLRNSTFTLMALTLAACGGSGDDSSGVGGSGDESSTVGGSGDDSSAVGESDDDSSTAGPKHSGNVVKGPVSGARVFVDYNGDGQLDPDEPFTTTDESGFYSFENLRDNQTYEVIALLDGAVDQSSERTLSDGRAFKSTTDASVITPFTTMIADQGISSAQLIDALGLSGIDGFDPMNFNPYADGVDPADALLVEQTAQKVMTIVETLTVIFEASGLEPAEAYGNALKIVADQAKVSTDSAENLLSSSSVNAIIDVAFNSSTIPVTDLVAFKTALNEALATTFESIDAATELLPENPNPEFKVLDKLLMEVTDAVRNNDPDRVALDSDDVEQQFVVTRDTDGQITISGEVVIFKDGYFYSIDVRKINEAGGIENFDLNSLEGGFFLDEFSSIILVEGVMLIADPSLFDDRSVTGEGSVWIKFDNAGRIDDSLKLRIDILGSLILDIPDDLFSISLSGSVNLRGGTFAVTDGKIYTSNLTLLDVGRIYVGEGFINPEMISESTVHLNAETGNIFIDISTSADVLKFIDVSAHPYEQVTLIENSDQVLVAIFPGDITESITLPIPPIEICGSIQCGGVAIQPPIGSPPPVVCPMIAQILPLKIEVDGEISIGSIITAKIKNLESYSNIDFSFGWFRDGVLMNVESSQTYQIGEGDVGKELQVNVYGYGECFPYFGQVNLGVIQDIDQSNDSEILNPPVVVPEDHGAEPVQYVLTSENASIPITLIGNQMGVRVFVLKADNPSTYLDLNVNIVGSDNANDFLHFIFEDPNDLIRLSNESRIAGFTSIYTSGGTLDATPLGIGILDQHTSGIVVVEIVMPSYDEYERFELSEETQDDVLTILGNDDGAIISIGDHGSNVYESVSLQASGTTNGSDRLIFAFADKNDTLIIGNDSIIKDFSWVEVWGGTLDLRAIGLPLLEAGGDSVFIGKITGAEGIPPPDFPLPIDPLPPEVDPEDPIFDPIDAIYTITIASISQSEYTQSFNAGDGVIGLYLHVPDSTEDFYDLIEVSSSGLPISGRTLTFDFEDSNDVVSLASTSFLEAFTQINVINGTLDLSDLGLENIVANVVRIQTSGDIIQDSSENFIAGDILVSDSVFI